MKVIATILALGSIGSVYCMYPPVRQMETTKPGMVERMKRKKEVGFALPTATPMEVEPVPMIPISTPPLDITAGEAVFLMQNPDLLYRQLMAASLEWGHLSSLASQNPYNADLAQKADLARKKMQTLEYVATLLPKK